MSDSTVTNGMVQFHALLHYAEKRILDDIFVNTNRLGGVRVTWLPEESDHQYDYNLVIPNVVNDLATGFARKLTFSDEKDNDHARCAYEMILNAISKTKNGHLTLTLHRSENTGELYLYYRVVPAS